MSHKESSVIRNMVKIEDNFSDSNETEVDFTSIQSDIKLEIKDETWMDIKQEEIDIEDEVTTEFASQNDGGQYVDDSVPTINFQKSNQTQERFEDVSQSIGSDTKLEIRDETWMNIKQEEIDIKDEVPSTSTFHSDDDQDVDNNSPSVSFHKLNQKFMPPHKTHREKLFVCNVCGYKSAYKSTLTIHMRSHTGEKPFACSLCNYKSAQKGQLTMHITSHTGEKRFACSLCDYKTARKADLPIHMTRHTGEKRFACSLCDYKSAHKGNLTTHMANHKGEKRFACSLCDFQTAYKCSLTTHVSSHTGEKRFVCDLCDYKTARNSNLRNKAGKWNFTGRAGMFQDEP